MIQALNDLLGSLAGSPWIYTAVFAACLIDGFFPPLPSELLLTSVATVAAATGNPVLAVVAIAAAMGAFMGDSLAYLIGSRIPLEKIRWFQGARARKSIASIQSTIRRRTASVLLIGRFIPVGRVLVNMSAGAMGIPYRRFALMTALSGILWTGFNITIAVIAGSVLTTNPFVSVVIALAMATIVGTVIDQITRRTGARPIPQQNGSL